MNRGKLYILSGPSGSGKDTVLKKVLEKCDNIKLSISSITRAMREGEVEGEKYNFISREKFEEMLRNDALLEHNVYLGNYYGTPKAPVNEALEKGIDVILEIDVNGAGLVRKKCPGAVSVFITPPSFEVLEKRLSGRGTETKADVEKRLKAAVEEIKQAVDFDYIVVNDDLDDAVDEFIAVIKSQRIEIGRRKNIIDEVLKNAESRNW